MYIYDANGFGTYLLTLGPQEEQLDAILSTAVETSSLGLITGCIKQWTAEGKEDDGNSCFFLSWYHICVSNVTSRRWLLCF